MTLEEIHAAIEAEWRRKPPYDVWWGDMEDLQRAVLRLWRSGELDAADACENIDEILAAFTRRGSEVRK